MADTHKLYNILSGLYSTDKNLFERLSGHQAEEFLHITAAEDSYTSDDIGRVVRRDNLLYVVKEGESTSGGSSSAWDENDPAHDTITISNRYPGNPVFNNVENAKVLGTYKQQEDEINGEHVYKNSNDYYIAKYKSSASAGGSEYGYGLFTASQYATFKTSDTKINEDNGEVGTGKKCSATLNISGNSTLNFIDQDADVTISHAAGTPGGSSAGSSATTSYEESRVIDDSIFDNLGGISESLLAKMQ